MLGFDYELRRRGFAGNSCQIILELAASIDPVGLAQRLATLTQQHPILSARPARGITPRWKPTSARPRVRVHAKATSRPQDLFNEPLEIHHGELIRFDLIERTVVFTWAHALMDAKSAEYFLALVGDDQIPAPESGEDWYAWRGTRVGGLRARGRQAWRELDRLEKFKTALPVSLATRRPPTAHTLKYQVVTLSREESDDVRAHAGKLCGFFGDTTFHMAATLLEFHHLHERTGCPSASYVVPIPVGLRPKGTRAPLFSNQVTMMLHQFLPAQLATLAQAITAVKTQKTDFLRDDQIDAGIALAHLFRRLPMWLYMRIIKHELRGEICSLFFGDTSTVDSALKYFRGAAIEEFAHIPAVTLPPGVGVVFYRFNHHLQFTLVHAEGTLSHNEAAEFAARLRQRLLNP